MIRICECTCRTGGGFWTIGSVFHFVILSPIAVVNAVGRSLFMHAVADIAEADNDKSQVLVYVIRYAC